MVKGEPNAIIRAYRQRLNEVAGFLHVPEPISMKNIKDNNVYWLFFASHNPTGARIVRDIFRKYDRGIRN